MTCEHIGGEMEVTTAWTPILSLPKQNCIGQGSYLCLSYLMSGNSSLRVSHLTTFWGFLKPLEAPNHTDGIVGRFQPCLKDWEELCCPQTTICALYGQERMRRVSWEETRILMFLQYKNIWHTIHWTQGNRRSRVSGYSGTQICRPDSLLFSIEYGIASHCNK